MESRRQNLLSLRNPDTFSDHPEMQSEVPGGEVSGPLDEISSSPRIKAGRLRPLPPQGEQGQVVLIRGFAIFVDLAEHAATDFLHWNASHLG